VNLGETVTPGRECFRLVDFDPVRARLYFPERELGNVRVGQQAELTMDGRPGTAYPARVALVNPVVDHANGTFKVTIEAGNMGGALRPGGFVRVRNRSGHVRWPMMYCARRHGQDGPESAGACGHCGDFGGAATRRGSRALRRPRA
jgi:hypothetical protein